MIERTITIELETGLQARPAAQFVQEANKFSADVFIEKDEKRVNAKSIMGLMSLAVGTDEEIKLIADGSDEEEAVQVLAAFVKES
ncbi:catabolite repression HPr-like protein [Halobacillus karajensis]|uniref:Catabolite repression HPr n=1 Tax=Halobacillus karajensis TaxID=195088 RepID=A0A059NUZ5_9BACI|nr:HPr family phosphocarrier protein [Halobacillus karajensis]CDQ19267.1 Catabolite repression HPr [Halobacillus karajensis]CDQ22659.1 Catabolite repression HPr [Halobacillus karajensis]CDQ26141.1 Catabolite repression HPr [Halobacillus karajensis]SEH39152.1 catabolite repression HPr-like protein [Halobacillus karajensis]